MNEDFGAGNYESLPVVLTRGKGVYVEDTNNNRYIDMLSGYSALNQGHCHHKILKAAHEQLDKLTLTSRAFHTDKLGPFSKTLVELVKKTNPNMERALPMNSGAEGVETAIKLMRRWGYMRKAVSDGKAEIIVAENNFHGRTTTIIGFSSEPETYGGFGPATPGFVKVPFNDVGALKDAITPNTVGVLLEPIQGEAGVIIPNDNYLREVRKICSKNDVLMCLDEIQTGLGRTGKMFCYEHYDVHPDILILGKALSAGILPVSAVLTSKRNMDVFTAGSHGSTYGGNPFACAVSKAALEVLVEEGLPENAQEQGAYFLGRLKEFCHGRDDIIDVRGKGLLIAVEYKDKVAHNACLRLMEEGILAKDTHDKIVRFAPPLIIARHQIDTAMKGIRKAL